MKRVMAGPALLVGELLVGRHDRVANSTLLLALEGADDVSPEAGQAVCNGAALCTKLVSFMLQRGKGEGGRGNVRQT